jgi:hypothetical protein
MRALLLGTMIAAASGLAYAQPQPAPHSEEGMMCLETNGSETPAVCRVGDAWHDADLCSCGDGGMRFSVPVCAPGEKPPPDNVALDRARKDAMKAGTLDNLTVNGRHVCVVRHHPRSY